jgi:hypothetical protein
MKRLLIFVLAFHSWRRAVWSATQYSSESASDLLQRIGQGDKAWLFYVRLKAKEVFAKEMADFHEHRQRDLRRFLYPPEPMTSEVFKRWRNSI